MQSSAHSNPPADASSASLSRKRLVLVDGSGYIFRAYHAVPPLTRPDGVAVGAVYGFTTMLLGLRDTMAADYLAVIFDVGRITFRNDLYPEYKAHRPPPPDDLVPQFAIVREATRALNIPAIEQAMVEADDVIASYARAGAAAGMEVVIVSSDKDLMQLVNERITLYDPMKQKKQGREQVIEKFGVPPEQVRDVQALMGDSTDNVPGVPGIGAKTAAQLIAEFGSLEALLARAHEIKQPKRRESLEQFADQARLSYQLVQLKEDVPLPQPIELLAQQPTDMSVFLPFLEQQHFKSLLKKYGGTVAVAAPVSSAAPVREAVVSHYEVVNSLEALDGWIARIRAAGVVAIDTETTGLDATQAELVGISLAVEAGHACYIPLGHVVEVAGQAAGQGSLFDTPDAAVASSWQRATGQLARDTVLVRLKSVLADPAILKIGQNIKYDMQVLRRDGAVITPFDDTMLLSYVLAAGLHAHNMDELAQLHLQRSTIAYKEVVGTGKGQLNFSQVPIARATAYAAEDADVTLQLHQTLKPQLAAHQLVALYEQIERPLVPVIVAMEATGIAVDLARLRSLSAEFAAGLAALEREIHSLAGQPFNIASPKQLGEILFDGMGLSGGKKSSKTGAYATGADVLEELAEQGHALPAKVLEWRQLAKLKSTYTDALQQQINPLTGRVHTSFSLAATTTGRLSSSDPNLQNIPIRTAEGKRIREAFVAAQGMKLISADYSQIELRLLAHMADIQVLKQAFCEGADIHAATASQMFGVPLDAVGGDLRRKAKTINFGIIYGISAHGLAARLGIGRGEAADYIERYFAQYPGIKAYMERTKATAREQGYVSTLFGRRIHVKDIASSNANLRAFSERAAINAPLQGTAADIIKRAMIAVYQHLAQHYPEARLLLQVHDELIVEAPEAIAHEVAEALCRVMQGAASLSVPLLVDSGVGDHWGAIH